MPLHTNAVAAVAYVATKPASAGAARCPKPPAVAAAVVLQLAWAALCRLAALVVTQLLTVHLALVGVAEAVRQAAPRTLQPPASTAIHRRLTRRPSSRHIQCTPQAAGAPAGPAAGRQPPPQRLSSSSSRSCALPLPPQAAQHAGRLTVVLDLDEVGGGAVGARGGGCPGPAEAADCGGCSSVGRGLWGRGLWGPRIVGALAAHHPPHTTVVGAAVAASTRHRRAGCWLAPATHTQSRRAGCAQQRHQGNALLATRLPTLGPLPPAAPCRHWCAPFAWTSCRRPCGPACTRPPRRCCTLARPGTQPPPSW